MVDAAAFVVSSSATAVVGQQLRLCLSTVVASSDVAAFLEVGSDLFGSGSADCSYLWLRSLVVVTLLERLLMQYGCVGFWLLVQY